MKAIILSAGQGKRLLPLTEKLPKCLLPANDGQSLLGWQLTQLAKAGFEEAVIVSGFQAEKIRADIRQYQHLIKISELYNPFYKLADNLGSVWVARHKMMHDFVLLNGDTMFTYEVAQRLRHAAGNDVTLMVSRKESYDNDDMKVSVENGMLKAVGKKLPPEIVNGESIGMMKFSGNGISRFRNAVNAAMETEEGLKTWYLAVLDQMARAGGVGTVMAGADEWCEVDFPVDYKKACANIERWNAAQISQGTDKAAVS